VSKPTPHELITLYWEEIWNRGKIELIRDICGDPMIRHEPGKIIRLSHAEQIERVRKVVVDITPHFTHCILIADDVHVCSVWNMTSQSEKIPFMSGIEVFRAEDGRLTECWNPPYGFLPWGEVE
jgi:hypothetical protein